MSIRDTGFWANRYPISVLIILCAATVVAGALAFGGSIPGRTTQAMSLI